MKLTIYRYLAVALLLLGLLFAFIELTLGAFPFFAIIALIAAKGCHTASTGVVQEGYSRPALDPFYKPASGSAESMYTADPGRSGSRLNLYDH